MLLNAGERHRSATNRVVAVEAIENPSLWSRTSSFSTCNLSISADGFALFGKAREMQEVRNKEHMQLCSPTTREDHVIHDASAS